jgi:hypothetical protein
MSRAPQPRSAVHRRMGRLAWVFTALAGCLNPRPEELPSYAVGPRDPPPGPATDLGDGAGSAGLPEPQAPGDLNGNAGTGGSGAGGGEQPSTPSIPDAGADAGAPLDAEPLGGPVDGAD